MKDKTMVPLTVAEMSSLWAQYISDTAGICVNTYFLKNIEDDEVADVIKWIIHVAKENIKIMEEIFRKENFPIPVGFTTEDVKPHSPKLYADSFVLQFLHHMGSVALSVSSSAIAVATRQDIIAFHQRVLNEALELHSKSLHLMLKRGTFTPPTTIPPPHEIDFIEKKKFLGWYFTNNRSLTSVEITHLFKNCQTNLIGKALLRGFAQTATNKKVEKNFVKGIEIAKNHVTALEQFLKEEDLPVPASLDSEVSDATSTILSDKLMLYYSLAMNAAGIENYAGAMAKSLRKDLAMQYAVLMPETTKYASEGINLMIENGWLEQPSKAIDRKEIFKEKDNQN